MMNAERATQVAQDFIGAQERGAFRYTFSSVKPSKRIPGQWLATFRVEAEQGGPIDGSAVVVVDEEGSARFLFG